MQKLSHQEIVLRQKSKKLQEPYPITIIANNLRSLYNVGSIFRTCDGLGVEKLWLCGITGYPPNNQISKTALGAEAQVSWEYRGAALSVVRELKEKDYEIVLLEQTKASLPYQGFEPNRPVCLVIGNEIEGVEGELVSMCDCAVEIEMEGIKNSLNVSVAFGIVAYHIKNAFKSCRVF